MKKHFSLLLAALVVIMSLPLGLFAVSAATSEELVSVGKSYTVTGCGTGYTNLGGQWPAKYDANLTDGFAADALDFGIDSHWFAFYYSNQADESFVNAPDGVGSVTIDLEAAQNVTKLRAHLGNGYGVGIASPASLVASYSVDGVNYINLGSFQIKSTAENNDANNNAVYWTELTFDAVSARYVRFTFTLIGVFAFVDELEIYADPNAEVTVPDKILEQKLKDSVGIAENPEYNVNIEATNYGESGKIYVTADVANITHSGGLCSVEFKLLYDSNKLKLANGRNSDNSIDCVVNLPDTKWENLTRCNTEGEISVCVLIAEKGNLATENGDIAFGFEFDVQEGVSGALGFAVPCEKMSAGIGTIRSLRSGVKALIRYPTRY